MSNIIETSFGTQVSTFETAKVIDEVLLSFLVLFNENDLLFY